MTAPACMPFYIGDYVRDTMHLTRDQHGAYLLLIFACWMQGGKIANDDKILAAIVKADAAEWKILKPVMAKLFVRRRTFWTHKRIGIELEKADNLHQVREKAGKKGAETRWQSHAFANGKQVVPPPSPSPSPPAPPHPLPLLPPNTTTPLNPPTNGAAHERRQPARLPVDWQPDAADRQFAGELGLDAGEVASEFRDYWSAIAGRKATRLDWHATFRNACRLYAGRHHRSNGDARSGKHRQAGASFTAAIRRAFADTRDEGVE